MNDFKNILDSDEIVIKEFRPNKYKFYFTSLFAAILISIFSFGIMAVALLTSDDIDSSDDYIIIISILVGILLISILLTFLFTKLAYSKRLYAYTNKRILIQNGIIGIDYKSLDLEFIGASEVRVDVLDKLVKRNTGTIKFGSQATPTNTGGIQTFVFSSIEDPYNLYREIKKHIDDVKKELNK